MAEYLKTLTPASLIAIILVMAFVFKYIGEVGAFFFRDYWQDRKGQVEKRESALMANTAAIMKLQIQIEQLTDLLTIVPKLKADIDWAHDKIREIKNNQI